MTFSAPRGSPAASAALIVSTIITSIVTDHVQPSNAIDLKSCKMTTKFDGPSLGSAFQATA